LAVLVDAPNTWTIEVSQVIGPHTRSGSRQVVLSPTTTSTEFGSFTAAGSLAFQGQAPAAGHELCGHAALEELAAHPPGPNSALRLTTDIHDPTVRIENLVSSEQGVPAAELRGLAAAGTHRGESVDRITIRQYPLNATAASDPPASEQRKIDFAVSYILENESWVDILGHSDRAGSSTVKQRISEDRAQNIETELMNKGVPATITKLGLTSVPRFTRVEGLSDTQPPPSPLPDTPANRRRVDILMAGFPAGAQAPVSGTSTVFTPHAQSPAVPTLKASPDPCVAHLVGGAYP
jgi:outer membrane protein OmpA-like peptidoglycan-associated protein